ncbi:unnamed protein product [Fraxinus pennsylvanica]|uniref:V-type proton ATPase proteolipid subunit n=1 Tax=Fraxinus pennsylvanica TaxID=56036 RepID=A0AAD1ZLS2_9LAMI|nr:unnamed protein product [Fraxinus pennsylvanica]
MSSTFNSDETAPFSGFLGATAALIFSCMGATYGTAKSGVGVASMVMAGVLGIYGLIIAVIGTRINPKAKSYYLFDGYAHLFSSLACGLAGLSGVWPLELLGILVLDHCVATPLQFICGRPRQKGGMAMQMDIPKLKATSILQKKGEGIGITLNC